MTLSWQNSERKSHAEIIQEFLSPANLDVIDIGCGAGSMTRTLCKMGAKVIGLDPGDRQLERARKAKSISDEIYIKGKAESLPLDSASVDIVLFINSFHHITPSKFNLAITEARRVLRSDGKLYFAEPIANGPQFELSRLINDETEIRELAYKYIISTPNKGFKPLKEVTYITQSQYPDFNSFKLNSISINPNRDIIFEKYGAEIEKRFYECGIKAKGSFVFDQPVRGNLFKLI